MDQYKRVFAAIDAGSTSHAVADRAISWAADNRAELVLGHVVEGRSAEEGASKAEIEVATADSRKLINAILAGELVRARCDTRIPKLTVDIRVGSIVETLEEQIASFGADLVVCGERDLLGDGGLEMGSVAERLVRDVACDVLVVKQR